MADQQTDVSGMTTNEPTTPVDPDLHIEPELVESTRRLLRAIRNNRTDRATLRELAERLDEVSDTLEEGAMAGPYWETGYTSFEQLDLENFDPLSLFRFSPAVGEGSPLASPTDLRIEDGAVVGSIVFDETKVGPPFDIAHGGIIALVYDDLIGLAAMLGAGGGLTASLTVDYRKPTPVMAPIEVRAWFDRSEGRKHIARGEMRHDGVLLNEAHGLFIAPEGFPPGTAMG